MFDWLKSRKKIKTPAFSVEIIRVHHEEVAVRYVESAGTIEFRGVWVGSKPGQMSLAAPKELVGSELSRIVENLSCGLNRLGHEFVIYRTGQPEPIPDEERQAAIASLRELGEGSVFSPDGLRKLNFGPLLRRETTEQEVRLMTLIRAAKGRRTPVEVLAKSKAASSDFY